MKTPPKKLTLAQQIAQAHPGYVPDPSMALAYNGGKPYVRPASVANQITQVHPGFVSDPSVAVQYAGTAHTAAPVPLVPAHVSGTTGPQILGMPVALRQKYLRAQGYQVDVDGILGTQTKTATQAFLRGTPASTWNHAWSAHHSTVSAPAPGVTSSVAAPAPVAPAAPAAAHPAAAAAAPSGSSQLSALLQSFMGNQYQPPTPQQQAQLINAQVNAALAPQLVANRNATQQAALAQQQALAQSSQDSTRNANQQAGIAAALAKILKGQGPATEAAYRNATQDTGALAQGFSDQLRGTLQGDASTTNDYLRSIGAPEGQMVDPAKGGMAADVLYGTGGYIPGASLAREGAAFTAAANQLPQTAVGQGQQLASDALRAGTDERAKLRQDYLGQQQQLRGDLQTIQAGRPALLQNAQSAFQTQQNQNAATAQNNALLPLVLADKFEQFPGINPITGTPTKAGRDATLSAAKVTAAITPKFSASASRALGYRADSNGNPTGKRLQILPGFTINNQGQVVKSAGAAKKGKTLSIQSRQKFTKSADDAAKLMKIGGVDADGTQHVAIPYEAAVEQFRKEGFFSSQELRAIAMSALWGEYGNPGKTGQFTVIHTKPKGT